jgi:hypothetical protein
MKPRWCRRRESDCRTYFDRRFAHPRRSCCGVRCHCKTMLDRPPPTVSPHGRVFIQASVFSIPGVRLKDSAVVNCCIVSGLLCAAGRATLATEVLDGVARTVSSLSPADAEIPLVALRPSSISPNFPAGVAIPLPVCPPLPISAAT